MALDLEGIALRLILRDCKEEGTLDIFAKIKEGYFSNTHLGLFKYITNVYIDKGYLPSENILELSIRDRARKEHLAALLRVEIPEEIDLEMCVDALEDAYTQELTLGAVDTLLDRISILSSSEIKNKLSGIALDIEDRTSNTSNTMLPNEVVMFDNEALKALTPLGLSNAFDSHTGGVSSGEFILIGGERGSGKSITGLNICMNQVDLGNVGMFLSIEMSAQETIVRAMAIAAEIDHTRLKLNRATADEMLKLAKARAAQFKDSDQLLQEYTSGNIKFDEFERKLNTLQMSDNPLIIIANSELSLVDIDVSIQKAKARYANTLRIVVVDYINVIIPPGGTNAQYEWVSQITVAKALKNIAVKHDVAIISPYQVNEHGEARFSKGILDSADIALVLKATDDAIEFNVTKIRSSSPINTVNPINWSCLKIDPTDQLKREDTGDTGW